MQMPPSLSRLASFSLSPSASSAGAYAGRGQLSSFGNLASFEVGDGASDVNQSVRLASMNISKGTPPQIVMCGDFCMGVAGKSLMLGAASGSGQEPSTPPRQLEVISEHNSAHKSRPEADLQNRAPTLSWRSSSGHLFSRSSSSAPVSPWGASYAASGRSLQDDGGANRGCIQS